MFFFCDLHLSDSESVQLECESLEMFPIILAVEAISCSTSISLWGRLHACGTRDTQVKGHYHFVNEILLNITEMDFQDFMPPNQDQNTRQNFCILPSIVLSCAEALYAFDDGGGDNLEAVFAHICLPWKAIFFLSGLGRTLLLQTLDTNSVLQPICLNLKNMA